jgi:hypothetical protein
LATGPAFCRRYSEKLAQRAGFAQRRRSRLAVELSWVERGRFFHCWRVGELPELHGEVKR